MRIMDDMIKVCRAMTSATVFHPHSIGHRLLKGCLTSMEGPGLGNVGSMQRAPLGVAGAAIYLSLGSPVSMT